MSDNILNPFKPGDLVVCITDSWYTVSEEDASKISLPKKGDILTVYNTRINLVSFAKHNIDNCVNWFTHDSFAPVQDATDMQFDDEEIQVLQIEEMTV